MTNSWGSGIEVGAKLMAGNFPAGGLFDPQYVFRRAPGRLVQPRPDVPLFKAAGARHGGLPADDFNGALKGLKRCLFWSFAHAKKLQIKLLSGNS